MMLEECLIASDKPSGRNVIILGCFGYGSVGDMYRIKMAVNK